MCCACVCGRMWMWSGQSSSSQLEETTSTAIRHALGIDMARAKLEWNGTPRLTPPHSSQPSPLPQRVHPLPFSLPLQTVIPPPSQVVSCNHYNPPCPAQKTFLILSSAGLAQTPILSQQSKVFSGKKYWLVYVHSSSLPHSGGSITKVWKKTVIRNRGPYQLISSLVSLLKFTGLDLLTSHSAQSVLLATLARSSPRYMLRMSCEAFWDSQTLLYCAYR